MIYGNQTSIGLPAGAIVDGGPFHRRETRSVGGDRQEIHTLTVSGSAATSNTITTSDGATATFTGDAASNAANALAMYNAIQASGLFGLYEVTYPGSGAVVTLKRRTPGVSFTITVSAGAGNTITDATSQAADAGDALPPGIFVIEDPSDTSLCLPPTPSTITDTWTITPASVNSSDDLVFDLAVEQPDGTWIPYNKKVDVAASVQLTVEAIQPILDAIDGIACTENNTAATLTHGTPGLRIRLSVQVIGGNGTTSALANTIAGDGNPFYAQLLGAVCLIQDQEAQDDGTFTYEPGQQVSVCQVGEIDLLTESGQSLSIGSAVYVRATASGSEQKGAIRATSDSGDALPVRGIEVLSASRTGLDGQTVTRCRINL